MVQQNNEEILIIPSYVFKVKPNFFLLKLSSLFRLKTRTCTQHAKYTMVNVSVVKII